MKKFLIIAFSALATLFAASSCDQIDTDTNVKWADLVKEHTWLDGFPEFEGEINLPQYTSVMGMESIAFLKKTEETVFTDYCKKLESKGFQIQAEAVKGSYRKKVDGGELIFAGTWAAGVFGLTFTFVAEL